jgi:hypothetical protein
MESALLELTLLALLALWGFAAMAGVAFWRVQ